MASRAENFLRKLYQAPKVGSDVSETDQRRAFERAMLEDEDIPEGFMQDPGVTKAYLERLQALEWRKGL